ncbi:hypothetical protein Aab01nite_73880 [Paractinoplanes abujensis]|uniref:Fimbrial assembly family protein n=1 Tax=Paractinoplanes abujensis TaxID=882441 RepID=A0A7W7CUT1_9ACTN|nr:hypothetical protein [Actinoplanes abujensis]MBB4695067.1 hypothetical protein [Actinoplanes abujensis]GID23798.1 hypothetical protein Aab01nite_73880 [Actinoplanes abujensis]
MTTTQTSLMPVDPAVSPAQASRVLAIRANLLPDEITAGRNARRTRSLLIATVLAVIAGLGGWYVYAVQNLDSATENLTSATDSVAKAQNDKKKYAGVTGIISDRDQVKADLKTLMANDLPWAKTTDTLRSTAAAANVTVKDMGANVVLDAAAPAADGKAAAATERTVAMINLTGQAPDKTDVAVFVDKLAGLKGFADPYVTSVSKNGEEKWDYALSVKVTSAALCGRFTTACAATGGN